MMGCMSWQTVYGLSILFVCVRVLCQLSAILSVSSVWVADGAGQHGSSRIGTSKQSAEPAAC